MPSGHITPGGPRRTKIIATYGPACSDLTVLAGMVAAGLDVLRINFSHFPVTEPGALARVVDELRAVAAAAGRPVAVLGDLAGPKLRMTGPDGPLSPFEITEGDRLILLEPGARATDAPVVVVPVPGLASKVGIGERVLLADGAVQGEVVAHLPGGLELRITAGGTLGQGKGVAFPDGDAAGSAVTEADLAALEFVAAVGLEFVAVSFARSAAELDLVRSRAGGAGVIAKIERRAALGARAELLAAADGIMVARGDLGVELAPELLPGVQKALCADALAAGCLAIVATEMLESMVHASRPTRAEVSDVANAALDGAGAVMLSAETAIGVSPAEAVAAMDRILTQVEADEIYHRLLARSRRSHGATRADDGHAGFGGPLSESATQVGELVGAAVLVTVTETGRSAQLLSAARPGVPIVAACHDPAVARRLAVVWGVTPVLIERLSSSTAQRRAAVRAAASVLGLKDGVAIVLSGAPHRDGAIDTLRVMELSEAYADVS